MAGRWIAIGDIHGCRAEFERLLETVRPDASDAVVLVGDLVNRGPDSHGVIRIAESLGATCLLGNHERRLLAYREHRDADALKPYDKDTLAQLTLEDWTFLERMQLTCEVAAIGTVFVHGGFLPQLPWKEQEADIVTEIQVVDPDGHARKRSDAPDAPHWSSLWAGPPFVVYGHTPLDAVQWTAWTCGIDTGCVYGGALTACIFPEKRLVAVPAERDYS